MATTVFDPSDEGVSPEQQAAETAALEQGEKIAQMQQEDKNRAWDDRAASNDTDPSLIGGKFKSQEDLLKAYQELQSKLGKGESEEGEEPSEEQPEAPEETPEEVPEETPEVFSNAAKQYSDNGQLDEATIEELSKMDTKDLITQYMAFYNKSAQEQQQVAVTAQAQADIVGRVGGQESYSQMVAWAADNLGADEIADYNAVTNSGNVAAIKFAVEALNNRYKAAEGYEAPLVTGKKASAKVEGFRSNAELSRAIADPRYHNDPAYRQDVEQKLARSGNLL